MIDQRLPWNGKEGLVYGGVIAFITCVFMITFGVCTSNGGFDADLVVHAWVALPFAWISAMALILLFVENTSRKIASRFVKPTDSFYAQIVFNIIPCVLMMSAMMTIIGPSIGYILQGEPVILAVQEWPVSWPRNFCAAFWCEMLLAQPIARALMKYIHTRNSTIYEGKKTA